MNARVLENLTEKQQKAFKQLFADMVEDASEDFSGEYVIEYNRGGISGVTRKAKKDYPHDT